MRNHNNCDVALFCKFLQIAPSAVVCFVCALLLALPILHELQCVDDHDLDIRVMLCQKLIELEQK